MNKLVWILLLVGIFMYLKSQHMIEGFGSMGAQAQLASNQGDSTLYGGSGGGSSPMASNGVFEGLFGGSVQNETLTGTSPDEYRMMVQGQGRGSSGVPNYAGMFPMQQQKPVRPIHPPEFTPEIQHMLMRREREQHANRYSRYRSYHITGIAVVDAVLSKVMMLLQQIFELIIGVLNVLLGWAF